jgi:ABC-type phosphate/phosphonate transport system substrate-binding protein
MYDWPEVRDATDALWRAVAGQLRAAGLSAPEALDRKRPREAIWRDPGLVFSQTCGFPYATRLRGEVRLLATPIYAVEGCDGPRYSSAIVVRADEGRRALADFAGRRVAFNSRDSLSGYVAFAAAASERDLKLSDLEPAETGSHRESLRAVAAGRADIAAIDAVCWALAHQFEGDAVADLAVVEWTPLRPSLPFITARGRSDADVALLRDALREVLDYPGTKSACVSLHLTGSAVLDEADYASIAKLNPDPIEDAQPREVSRASKG